MPSRHVHWDDDLTARNTARNRRPGQTRMTPSALSSIPDVRGFNANTWAWTAAPPHELGSDGRMHEIPSVSEAMARERERMRRDRERDLGRRNEINEVVREGQEEEWAWQSEWRREWEREEWEREEWEREEWEREEREWMGRRYW
jgi:hypothetical protein